MKRKSIDLHVIALLSDKDWLTQKLIIEQYSCSRLAKELGTTRTTVEKYRILHGIVQQLTQKELTTITHVNKSSNEKHLIIQRRKETNILLYGAENTFQSHKDKIAVSMLEQYGVRHALQHSITMLKQKKTMLKRHGVEHAVHSPHLYQKQLDTNVSRYGTNPAKLKTFKDKAKHTNIDKYGVEHFSQKHLSPEILANLADRLWLVDQHHTQKKTLSQIANELGCNITTVYRYCVNQKVEIKYYFESAAQREISEWLLSLNFDVHTNIRNIIKGELDIYIPQHSIAIEYCGVFWHSDAHARIKATYHLNKLKQCQDEGIRLITLFEDEWLYKKEIVKSKLLNILGRDTEGIYARKCKIQKVVERLEKQRFFDRYHIQGDGPGSITYSLQHNDEPVAMMTFIRQQDDTYVLNRYASSSRVVGGFQKLLKHFCGTHVWKEIISFADMRWSEGGVYDRGGFVLDKVLPPDYRYVIGNNTYHKFAFRRKALEKLLPNFDPVLSEVQNMRNAGYYRIWNCGLLRYVLTPTSTVLSTN